ncbi:unnamed protein product [Microthlaspi erraticum]|uniref:Uncharacterized protein n=1 Tax=Microthlaspi erraticum TaxID=1685480 RepID=A0A6D2JYI1_9BRAS|nr:unnamed protein product [Microthlaspi erraticum]
MPHTTGSAAELPLPRKSTHTNLERSGGSAVRDLSTSESYSTYGPHAPPCYPSQSYTEKRSVGISFPEGYPTQPHTQKRSGGLTFPEGYPTQPHNTRDLMA